MLHIVNKAPPHSALDRCLRYSNGSQAIILLIEDGVYAAVVGTEWAQQLLDSGATIWVLEPDVEARGIGGRIEPGIGRVDFSGFVELCCQHHPIQSWY
ncbi:MAG: sulfurtransferase complex subunit TusB [Spongiibacteraceae bacterium]|jgi:tRNA 2-thiouridine synthesizing protein B|nr:sulfurtransferase complex subunit TusB [Spongiibacteraceae bacterium]